MKPDKSNRRGFIRIILKEKEKNPFLGVRKLSQLIQNKYGKSISKTTIHRIIKERKGRSPQGRKKYLLWYKGREKIKINLFLLKGIDSLVRILDYLKEELRPYFPKLKSDELKNILTLGVIASLEGKDVEKNLKEKEFLRALRLYTLSYRKINYFLNQLNTYSPAIFLNRISDNLKIASAVKFYFNNGCCAFCDARLSTFWQEPPEDKEFLLPFLGTQRIVKEMLKAKVVMVNYTQSFDSLSKLTSEFIKAFSSGLKKITILDTKGENLDEFKVDSNLDIFIGYFPLGLSKGIRIVGRKERIKKISWDIDNIFYTSALTLFSQLQDNQEIILNNILLFKQKASFPFWGIITNKRRNLSFLIKKYLNLWPFPQEKFKEEIKKIEKSFLENKKRRWEPLSEGLSGSLVFNKVEDFKNIGKILTSIFDWLVEKEFNYFTGKAFISYGRQIIRIKISLPLFLKRRFNSLPLYLEGKKILLI